MERYKLGRLPAVRPVALADLAVYASALPAPPAAVDVPKAPYPIDGNDRYGDCTIAGVAHLIAAWNAEVKDNDHVPNGNQVVAQYFKLSGGTDTGLNEHDVLRTWQRSGLFGHRIAAYAPVQPTDIAGLHRAVAFYGGAYLGIECPESCQEQFQAGKPWTYEPDAPIEGGHCIVALGYDAHYVYCATWGGVAPVTYAFLAHYLEETWAVIPAQFVDKGHDALGVNLAALQGAISKL